MIRTPSLAIVQDALPFPGGAESALEAVLEIAPTAPIYTAVYCKERFADSVLGRHTVRTSFIDRLPGAHSSHYRYAPLFPLAMERFDLRGYETILSCSYAFAHGIIAEPDQLHISYMYTPLRYAWQRGLPHASLTRAKAWITSGIFHYLRLWDAAAAVRVDRFVAISKCVAARIWRAYRRRAQVIYPPVDVDSFRCSEKREDYYVAIARLVPHKRVALIVDAFSRLGYPLYVVGDGPEYQNLVARAGPNVRLLGRQPKARIVELLSAARAFVHAGEEDFGIAPLEAQAAGCPVIAYGKGAIRETVIDGRTGLFFSEPRVESLIAAVRSFTEGKLRASVEEMRQNAERFAKGRFQREMEDMIEREWAKFRRRHGA